MNKLKELWYKLRLGWVAVFGVSAAAYIRLAGSDLAKQQGGVLAWKLVLVCAALAVAHLIRGQLFPYVDVSASLEEKTVAGSLVFLGMVTLYAAIILSVCSGL